MSIQPLPNEVSTSDRDSIERDHALMRQIRAGDESALEALLGAYWTHLVGYVERLLSGTDAAEDVVQEAFIRLWQNRAVWEERGSVQAYLYRAARNLALNEQRRRKALARWADRLRRHPMAQPSTPPDEVFDGHELEQAVERALAALPERRREVFVLVRHHGMTYQHTADVMGISPQTVANQMSAALAELRRALAPYTAEPARPVLRLLRAADAKGGPARRTSTG
jgi:RNA polymerase sigma-70 factor (ECF subfamily)